MKVQPIYRAATAAPISAKRKRRYLTNAERAYKKLWSAWLYLNWTALWGDEGDRDARWLIAEHRQSFIKALPQDRDLDYYWEPIKNKWRKALRREII